MLKKGGGVIILAETKVQCNQWDCTIKHHGFNMWYCKDKN